DEHLPLSKPGETGVANGSRARKRSLVLGGGQTHTPPTKAGETDIPVCVACHVHPFGSAGERQSLSLSAPFTVHASDELDTAVQLGGAYHLVLPTSAHALNPDWSLFAFRHGVGLLANYTYTCLHKKSISRIGLSCGNSQRSSRHLSPSCPLGVCHQAAW